MKHLLMTFVMTLSCSVTSVFASSIINPGTHDWISAATSGRADMLIIGDSIVNHGVMGWTGGIAAAASSSLGLAGTEMMGLATPAIYPGRAGGRALLSSDWKQPTTLLPDHLESYPLGTETLQSGTTQPGAYNVWIGRDDDGWLDRSSTYDWQLWVAGTNSIDGSIQASRAARTITPSTRFVLESKPAVTVPTSITAPHLIEFAFDATPGEERDYHEFSLENTSDTAIFYNRLIDPSATGITVTGWGYSGHPTRNFVTNLYDNGRLDQSGRAAYLSALVHGNSGKLNVVIAEGVNDSTETDPSLTEGITPGNSPEAFIDNVQTLIGLMRSDWSAAGFVPNDLSFTLLSPYQSDPDRIGITRWNLLADYRDALHALATTDSRYSFIDMWEVGPNFEEAVAENYIRDGVHPSVPGALLYGGLFMNELLELPEPSVMTSICLLLGTGISRRSRKVV